MASFIDYPDSDEAEAKPKSREEFDKLMNEFGIGDKTTAEELIRQSSTDGEQLSAKELLEISSAPQEVRIRSPSILTRVREATGVFKQPVIKQKGGFWKTINRPRPTTPERLPKKFKYFRDKSTGKIYKRTINPAFIKATNQAYDLAGRPRSARVRDTKFRTGSKQFLSRVLPAGTLGEDTDTKIMNDLIKKKFSAMKKMSGYSAGMQATAMNYAEQHLKNMQARYNDEENNRMRKVIPINFSRRINEMHDQNNLNKRQFSRREDVNLLQAHRNLDKSRVINPLDVSPENNILMAENLFSESNPRKINIMSKRPSILDTKNLAF